MQAIFFRMRVKLNADLFIFLFIWFRCESEVGLAWSANPAKLSHVYTDNTLCCLRPLLQRVARPEPARSKRRLLTFDRDVDLGSAWEDL